MNPRLLAGLLSTALASSALFAADAAPRRRVAMVFDDGPVAALSAKYQALLAQEKVRVTFANVGRNVAANPELTRAASAGGHEIINHSFTHPHFKELTDAAITREVSDTSAAIKSATGKAPAWYWAPFGDWDDRIAAAVRNAGLEHYPIDRMHMVSTEDWNRETSAATILQRGTTDITDRNVILCHEWREDTLAQLPAILAELKRQGCEFITFSELAALPAKS
jgi:peptidoglycan/xylan/chitin deacetylase (PgdA/CDA1 family)